MPIAMCGLRPTTSLGPKIKNREVILVCDLVARFVSRFEIRHVWISETLPTLPFLQLGYDRYGIVPEGVMHVWSFCPRWTWTLDGSVRGRFWITLSPTP